MRLKLKIKAHFCCCYITSHCPWPHACMPAHAPARPRAHLGSSGRLRVGCSRGGGRRLLQDGLHLEQRLRSRTCICHELGRTMHAHARLA